MSVNKKIKAALQPLALPCAANEYTGEESSYFVFSVSPMPVDFADDMPQHIKNLIQLHLYCPHTKNTVALRRQIKRQIAESGFTYPVETDASEKEIQHVVFEFEDVEAV
ncbi:MAG: hypothetical protein PUI40_07555 [Oscillospiraceae bacterium]|nr:hypothetical protein [Oscillospiraceae bacterium]MDD7041798.1 hypothetical protein [Oscillospiraceae bacterium]MDY2610461.1 hypothetical protein [Oscillospiraceae bacterium]